MLLPQHQIHIVPKERPATVPRHRGPCRRVIEKPGYPVGPRPQHDLSQGALANLAGTVDDHDPRVGQRRCDQVHRCVTACGFAVAAIDPQRE